MGRDPKREKTFGEHRIGEQALRELEEFAPLLESEQQRRQLPWGQGVATIALIVLVVSGFLAIQSWSALHIASPRHTSPAISSTAGANGWCVVAGPALGPTGENPPLSAISGVAANDIWATGSSNDLMHPMTMIEHWNGQDWTTLPLPDTHGIRTKFNAIRAIAANNVWAVGFFEVQPMLSPTPGIGELAPGTGDSQSFGNASRQTNPANPNATVSGGAPPDPSRLLVEHWNGQHWSIVFLASPTTWGGSALSALSVVSANDIWIGGYYEDRSGLSTGNGPYQLGRVRPLVEHWDGTNWNMVSNPAFSHMTQITTISAFSGKNVWIAMEGTYPDAVSMANPFLHWDGSQWQMVANPQNGSFLTSLSAASATNIWAIGSYWTRDPNTNIPTLTMRLVEHWDGMKWTVVNTPDATPKQIFHATVTLSSVFAGSANTAWIVGYASDYQTAESQQVVEHWDGQHWQVVPQNRDEDLGQLLGVTSVAGKIWAVGISYTGYHRAVQGTLIETNCH